MYRPGWPGSSRRISRDPRIVQSNKHGAVMKTTKLLLSACLGVSSLVVAGAAMAADAYPSKPIKVIVGYPAGGANDLVARAIGQEMSKDLGQQVVVENVSGAAGTIGAASAARAAPDGYTLFMAAGAHTLAPSVRKS